MSPSNIYFRRKLLNQAINLLPNLSMNDNYNFNDDPKNKFIMQLKRGAELIYKYEDINLQNLARSVIDYDLVYSYAQEFLENSIEKSSSSGKNEEDVALLSGLLRWFKRNFFKWCNKPECTNINCLSFGSQSDMESLGTEKPTTDEILIGQAVRTEIYKCKSCQNIERFPRFTNPGHLLVTRRGRCGEWASAFCLICRSLNLDARWVLDFTDHVWVEIWLPSLRRFVHADPCENKYDTPLLYETGWNKSLEYILSFSRYGVIDSTPKYTRKLNSIISKRSLTLNEKFVQDNIKKIDLELEMKFVTSRRNNSVSNSSLINLQLLNTGANGFDTNIDISIMTMKRRKRLLSKELVRLSLMGKPGIKEEEIEGRISGDLEWKQSRGEIGDGTKVFTSITTDNIKFPIIKEYLISSSSSISTAEIDCFGIGLDNILDDDDDTILKCNQTAISLLNYGWFDCTNIIIIDPINGTIIINDIGNFNNINYTCNPTENQKRILQIFNTDYKLCDIEHIKLLLKKERLIVYYCYNSSIMKKNIHLNDKISNLISIGYLSRLKFIINKVSDLSNFHNGDNSNNNNNVVMKYIHLGGEIHPDTLSFDTIDFLSSIIEFLSINSNNVNENKLIAWKQFTINQVTILASSILTNGFQIHYNIPFSLTSSLIPINIPSPLFTSYNDNPTTRCLNLVDNNNNNNNKINSITVNCGSLVDKIELITDNNTIFTCGGNGGTSKSFNIPNGWVIFYITLIIILILIIIII